MPTQKSRAEYMRERRAALKAAEAEQGPPIIGNHEEPRTAPRRDTRLAKIDPPVIKAEPGSDRANGLPRSNYFTDWGDSIRRMDQRKIDAILNHPAIKTPKREKS